MPTPPSPDRLALLRALSLGASALIALAAGTNYVYSAYAPQLGQRLHLDAKQLNLIGTAGNLGMYVTGIPSGLLVDRRGPRLPILLGALAMFLGYWPVWVAMQKAGEVGAEKMDAERLAGTVVWLCACMALTGAGSSFAFAGALKTAAINFPHHRGSATAVVLAAFGLSAFAFSTLSAWIFPGNTVGFLLVLATATSGMTALGFLCCRIVPVSGSGQGGYRGVATVDEDEDAEVGGHVRRKSRSASRKRFEEQGTSDPAVDENSALCAEGGVDRRKDVQGWGLVRSGDFWYLFAIMGCLAGCGLVTINNVGHDAQALWNFYDPHLPADFLQRQQSLHVSLLSLSSFTGRLLSGILSDLLTRSHALQRANLLIASAAVFVLAQLAALVISNPHYLFFVSTLNGLGYGMLFGVSPTIVSEFFGVNHMSTNWGALTLAAVVGGNVGNMAYGVVFDGNSRRSGTGQLECGKGLECYRDAYWVTLGMAVVGGAAAAGLVKRNRGRGR